MEAQPVRRSESLRKRTLEARRSVGGGDVAVPPKQRENDEDSEEITDRGRSLHDRVTPPTGPVATVDLKQFHQAHDVEEHFRRSLETMQLKQHQQNAASSGVSYIPPSGAVEQLSRVGTMEHQPHRIMVSENSTHPVAPPVTSKPNAVVTLSSSTTSSFPKSSSSPSSSTPSTSLASAAAIQTPHNIQYFLNSATGTMFAAGIPSNQVSGGVAGVQVPPVIFGFPSGLQQPVTVASTGGAHSVGQTSVGPVKLSPPKPSTTNADAQQQLLAAAAAAANMGPTGGILLPQLAPPATSSPGFIPILDSNGVPQLLATSSPATTVGAAPVGSGGGGGGAGGGNSPVILVGPGNVPVVSPSFFFINPSDLSTVQTASAVNAAAAGLVNFNRQAAIRNSTTPPGYIILPPAALQAPMSIGGLTQEQLLALATIQQQQLLQQQQQQQKASASPSPSPRVTLAGVHSATQQERVEPAATVQSLMAGGGGSVEDHFARALGEQWVKVKQSSTPAQNKITA